MCIHSFRYGQIRRDGRTDGRCAAGRIYFSQSAADATARVPQKNSVTVDDITLGEGDLPSGRESRPESKSVRTLRCLRSKRCCSALPECFFSVRLFLFFFSLFLFAAFFHFRYDRYDYHCYYNFLTRYRGRHRRSRRHRSRSSQLIFAAPTLAPPRSPTLEYLFLHCGSVRVFISDIYNYFSRAAPGRAGPDCGPWELPFVMRRDAPGNLFEGCFVPAISH